MHLQLEELGIFMCKESKNLTDRIKNPMRSMTTFIKTITQMIFIILSVLATFILILIIVLLFISPGKPEPYLDNSGETIAGSISEKVFKKIGGIRQGMFIRGKNINNPVLLYVHGGHAFPNYFLIEKYAPGLEDNFTVCCSSSQPCEAGRCSIMPLRLISPGAVEKVQCEPNH